VRPDDPASDPLLYGRSFADVYDDWYGQLDDPAVLVAAVRDRCPPGALIVEAGSGTGRLSTPLHAAGFEVVAVDASLAMLSAAPDGPSPVVADMSVLPVVDGAAELVLIAYNTVFNLPSHAQQDRFLAEAARVLRPGGLFAVEAFVAPDDLGHGVSFRPHPVDRAARLAIVTGPDPYDGEAIVGSHVELAVTVTARPWRLVYRSPGELDDAAMSAGLRRVRRFADWSGSEFSDDGIRHVSWYERI